MSCANANLRHLHKHHLLEGSYLDKETEKAPADSKDHHTADKGPALRAEQDVPHRGAHLVISTPGESTTMAISPILYMWSAMLSGPLMPFLIHPVRLVVCTEAKLACLDLFQ